MRTDYSLPRATREHVLEILREACQDGRRCPTNEEIRDDLRARGFRGIPTGCAPNQLANDGFCRIEVYGQNWRVVQIDGMRSQEPPERTRAPAKPPKVVIEGVRGHETDLDPIARHDALQLPGLPSQRA